MQCFLFQNLTQRGKIKGSNLSANSGVGGFLGRSNANGVTITNSYSLVDVANRAGDTTATADEGGIGIFVGGTGATTTTSITNSYGASPATNTRFVNGANAGTQTNTHSNRVRGSAALYDGLSATAGTAGLPAGLANTIWARVEANWPYLLNNVDPFLKRTKEYIPAPTAFKYAKKADGTGADTMALALGITAKVGLSGYDIKADRGLFNLTSTATEYDAGKKVTFVISDTAAAQPTLYTTETIATTTVGSSEQRAGLSNSGILVAAYDQTVMSAYDTITLMGDYYTVPILTGVAGSTAATLPIGFGDPFSLYYKNDMQYIDELHAIFGDSAGAGTTYTMKNDIDMGTAFINRLTNNEIFNAGTGGQIVLDGGENTLKVKVGGGSPNSTGLFGTVQGKLGIKNLDVNVAAWEVNPDGASWSAIAILIGLASRDSIIAIDNVHIDMNAVPNASNTTRWMLLGGMIGYAEPGGNIAITKSSVIDIKMNFAGNINHALGGLVGYSNKTASISESFVTGNIRGSNLSGNAGIGGFIGRANDTTNITNSYSLVDMANQAWATTATDATNGGIGIFIGGGTGTTSITKSYGASHATNTRFVNGGNANTQTQTHSNIVRGSAAVYDAPATATATLPTGFANTTWARVDHNWPYLLNNVDPFLKRTTVFAPTPTFKYAKKTDGTGVNTMALALGITAKAGLSGYDIKADTSVFNLTSTAAEYNAGKRVLFVISDTADVQPALQTIETIATTTVGGSAEQRAGLSNLGVVVAGYNQTAMNAYDTITLYGNYYGVPILTGATGTTPATLPIGIDAKGLYAANDMKYIDELHTIFGDSAGAGTTYTMRNNINMGAAINRLTNTENFDAGTGGRIVLDGGGKSLTVSIGGGTPNSTGLFASVQGKLGIQNLDVNVAGWGYNPDGVSWSAIGILVGLARVGSNIVINDVHVDLNSQPGTSNSTSWMLLGGMIGYVESGATTAATITKSSVTEVNINLTGNINHSIGGMVGYSNATTTISESFVIGTIRGSNLSGNAGVGGFIGKQAAGSASITNSYTSMNISNRGGTTAAGDIGIFVGGAGTISITKSFGVSAATNTRFSDNGNAGTQTQTYSNIVRGAAAAYTPSATLPTGFAAGTWRYDAATATKLELVNNPEN